MKRCSNKPVFLLGILATVIAFAVPLFYINRTPGNDWTYFNPLSLVVRSIVLHYHTLPLHNPWVCGGVDLLANPQSRVFSPLGLLDILLPPEWANLSAFIVCCLFGFVGMYRLLELMTVKHRSALVGAFLYVNGSYFGLHFAEGHATFGPFLLLPWSLYFFIRWTEPKCFFSLCFLQAFFIHSGAIYTFIFSILLCAGYAVLHPSTVWKDFSPSRRTLGIYALIALTSAFFALIKVLPILYEHSNRTPDLGFNFVPITQALHFLFDFNWTPQIQVPGQTYRAHELACYLSWLGSFLIALFLCGKKFFKTNYRLFLLVFFWTFVAFGWGGSTNPWYLFQKLPIINNAHVQSRLLILMYLFFILLLGRAFTLLENKPRLWIFLASILIAEGAFVRNYPYYSFLSYWSSDAPTRELITADNLTENIEVAWAKEHYFTGKSSKSCYEPAPPRGLPQVGGSDWKKLTSIKDGSGNVRLQTYTPGLMLLSYESTEPMVAQINANYLSGWVVVGGVASLIPNPEGLISLSIPPGKGEVKLRYQPAYGNVILVCFLIGCLGTLLLFKLRFWKTAIPFEYTEIPPGFYDKAFRSGGRIRRHWHETKFRRVIDLFQEKQGQSILDIGCAAGTFLGLVPEKKFSTQVGVDLSQSQVSYAKERYGTSYRKFLSIKKASDISKIDGTFDVITLIEVIEHLTHSEIEDLFSQLSKKLRVGGTLVITTPNYRSVWPVLEFAVNIVSEVGYWDQHITHFNAFNLEKKIRKLMGTHRNSFELEFKTTSHFITPFIAWLSPAWAHKLSQMVEPRKWNGHFGCLNLIVFKKISSDQKSIRKAV